MKVLWSWLLELCDLDKQPTVEEGAKALTRGGEVRFGRYRAFFGRDQPFIEPAVFLAQGEAFPRSLRQIRL